VESPPYLLVVSTQTSPNRRSAPQEESTPAVLAVALAERWINKRELAAHFSVSVRWVEEQTYLGMPSRLIGQQRRYQLSVADAWISETYDGE
jgi:hypothetical protein